MTLTILVLRLTGLNKIGRSSCLPDEDTWNTVWHKNVRFATLTDNLASGFNGTVDYTCHEINKAEENVWLVYPWENVSEY